MGKKKWFLTSVPLSNPVIKTHLFSITSQDLAEEDFELWTEEERGQSPEQIAYRCVHKVPAGVCWGLQKQLTAALHVLSRPVHRSFHGVIDGTWNPTFPLLFVNTDHTVLV